MGDSTKQVAYEITADGSAFIAAMEKSAAAATSAADSIKSKFESIGKAFEGVQKTLLVLTAIVAGGSFFKAAINESNKLTGETMLLSKRLGITAEQAGALNTALGAIGSDSETYVSAFDKFARQIRKNEQGLNDMGLKTRDANGNLRDSNTLFTEALGKVGTYKAGIDQNIAAQTFFGKGIAEVTALQKLNNEVLDAAAKKNKDLGLIITKENVEASKKYRSAMNDVRSVLIAVEKTIGDAVMPIFTQLAEWFSGVGPTAVFVFKVAIDLVATALQAVVLIAKTVWNVFRALADPLFTFGSAIKKLISGDLAGATDDMLKMGHSWGDALGGVFDKIKTDATRTGQEIANLWGKGTDVGKPRSGPNTIKEKSDKPEKDKSQNSQWEAELSERKLAFMEMRNAEGSFQEFSKQSEADFWRQKLTLTTTGTSDNLSVRKKIAETELSINKDRFAATLESLKVEEAAFKTNIEARIEILNRESALVKDRYGAESKEYQAAQKAIVEARRAATEQLKQIDVIRTQATRQAQMAELALEEQAAQLQKDLGLQTTLQLLTQQQQFEQRRYQISFAALQERLAIAQNDPDRNPVELARLHAELEALQQQHEQRMGQIRSQGVIESQRDVTSTLGAIQSSWSGLISKLMSGSMSLGGVIKGMFQSVAQAVIDTLGRLAAQWLVNQLLQRLMTKVSAVSQITGNAAVAGAAATASAAAIPLYGWALAPEAGAAAYASAMSYMGTLASAAGGYDIPASVNPITQLHAQEMVLPARYADVIRQMADSNGAGGGGGTQPAIHLHISAIDGPSVKRMLLDNQDHLATALRTAHRNGAFWSAR